MMERFFSVAKATLGLQRQRLQPATLEMILFLRMNDALWDANVSEIQYSGSLRVMLFTLVFSIKLVQINLSQYKYLGYFIL
ncbi:hypothetical protein PC121_g20923 [Phytophthora cactorum]|nr:hypothetical protein PC121_g20923 [Phytophthora cactorum]